MKMTSAYASKVLRKLNEDKEFWRGKEEEGCLYVAALDESGMSRSEFRDYLGEMFASSGVDSFGALLDYVDMEVAFEVGDELSSSELDDLNSTFSDDAGVDVEVTSGYHLSMEMTMTLLEDMNGYEAGETESQTQDVSGAYAIEIDGAWYVWMG